MGFAHLNQYLVKDLELPLGNTTYMVPPPSKEAGLILASLIATGYNTAKGQPSRAADLKRITDSKDRSLPELSLSADVHAQMLADGVPGVHIDQAAIYAMYYWTLGEESADAAFAALYAAAENGELPKDLSALKIGPNTESDSQTQTASTPATGSRPKTADRKQPAAKKAASRGVKPLPTGAGSSPTSPNTTEFTGAEQTLTGQPSETSS